MFKVFNLQNKIELGMKKSSERKLFILFDAEIPMLFAPAGNHDKFIRNERDVLREDMTVMTFSMITMHRRNCTS